LTLALVRDLREHRVPASAEELAGFETDVLAGFVLARASAGLADSTIRNDTGHLELIRGWFGRPLREMRPADADAYFGRVLRDARPSTRTGRAAALTVYFQFLELRHKIELHNVTGRVIECPLDEMNRPRAGDVGVEGAGVTDVLAHRGEGDREDGQDRAGHQVADRGASRLPDDIQIPVLILRVYRRLGAEVR